MQVAIQRINEWIRNNDYNIELDFNYLNLITLPVLPNNLKYLYCSNNQLTILPTLPNSLVILNCSYNQLSELPELHNNLIKLNCYNNQLNYITQFT